MTTARIFHSIEELNSEHMFYRFGPTVPYYEKGKNVQKVSKTIWKGEDYIGLLVVDIGALTEIMSCLEFEEGEG